MSTVVLDAWALLAWLGGEEPAATRVHQVFDSSARGDLTIIMSTINLGEVFYMTARRHGKETASDMLVALESAPFETASATDERVSAAALLKASYPISYADAFAASLALEHGCPLMTGDQELHPLVAGEGLEVVWLERGSRS